MIFGEGRPRRAASWARTAASGRASEAVARPANPRTLRRVGSDRLMFGSLPASFPHVLSPLRYDRISEVDRVGATGGPVDRRGRGVCRSGARGRPEPETVGDPSR